MPVLRPGKVPPEYPLADLLAILEPWLWADITPVSDWRSAVSLYIEVRGMVRPPEGLPSAEGITDQRTVYAMARKVREHYAATAELAIGAAENAGYRHDRHPELDMGGTLYHGRRDTGEPDILRAEARLTMWLTR